MPPGPAVASGPRGTSHHDEGGGIRGRKVKRKPRSRKESDSPSYASSVQAKSSYQAKRSSQVRIEKVCQGWSESSVFVGRLPVVQSPCHPVTLRDHYGNLGALAGSPRSGPWSMTQTSESPPASASSPDIDVAPRASGLSRPRAIPGHIVPSAAFDVALAASIRAGERESVEASASSTRRAHSR